MSSWVRREEALSRDLLDGVAVLPPEQATPLCLRGTAADVWHLLAEPAELSEIAAALGAVYEADPAHIAREIRPFLDELARSGALRVLP